MLQHCPKLHREILRFPHSCHCTSKFVQRFLNLNVTLLNTTEDIILFTLLLFSDNASEESVIRQVFDSIRKIRDCDFLQIQQTQPKLGLHLTTSHGLAYVDLCILFFFKDRFRFFQVYRYSSHIPLCTFKELLVSVIDPSWSNFIAQDGE